MTKFLTHVLAAICISVIFSPFGLSMMRLDKILIKVHPALFIEASEQVASLSSLQLQDKHYPSLEVIAKDSSSVIDQHDLSPVLITASCLPRKHPFKNYADSPGQIHEKNELLGLALRFPIRMHATTRTFFEKQLNTKFNEERHHDGPLHFSSYFCGFLLELYPTLHPNPVPWHIELHFKTTQKVEPRHIICPFGYTIIRDI